MICSKTCARPCRRRDYFRNSIKIREIRTLITTIVVIGRNSLNPGRSIRKSPGSRPSGSFETHGQASPTSEMMIPRMKSARCMGKVQPESWINEPSGNLTRIGPR